MSHIRFPRAAVALDTVGRRTDDPRPDLHPPQSPAPLVLWASHALPVGNGGRVLGVRRIPRSAAVEVAWMAAGDTRVQWVAAHLLLNEAQARRWMAKARFSRR